MDALAGLIALAPGLLARYILGAAHLLARVPYHAVYFDNPYLKYWLGYVYLLFGLAYLLRPKARRKYALATVLAVGTLALTIHLGTARYDGLLHAVVLDVGQGESVVLADHGEFALVDCGSSNRWVRAGEVAANRLRSMGCRELDVLLLTHDDYDHTSGVPGLLDRLPVRMLLIPEGLADSGLVKDAAARGVKVKTITDLAALDLGEARLTVYPPVGEDGDNERGLSLLTTSGECDLLLTGDMDSATERTLLARYDLPDIEVLVVGHHGSKNSTSNDLLDALAPETAVISVGSSNRYGHPSDEAMRRLAEHGCAVYRTDLQGDVHLSLSKTPFRQSELSMKQGDHYGIREKTEQVRQ